MALTQGARPPYGPVRQDGCKQGASLADLRQCVLRHLVCFCTCNSTVGCTRTAGNWILAILAVGPSTSHTRRQSRMRRAPWSPD